jgi:hypothetical protein
VPAGFGADAVAIRARFIADAGYTTYDEALALGLHWQGPLDRHVDYDEIVLWFEHDLFDQLLLIRHLAFFDDVQRTNGVWLICTDQYLGPMSAEKLARMYELRTQVNAQQRALGVHAWTAFTSTDAPELQRVVDDDTSALPFLHGALVRMLEEYPSTANGLGRIDAHALGLLAARAHAPAELFAEYAKLEERIFLGDITFWKHVERMAHAATPLVELRVRGAFEDRFPEGEVRITDAGRNVVAGNSDAVELNGIDRWLGGVHLKGTARWRWDAARKQIAGR